MKDWYEKNIELKVRPFVKVLRENGINTTSSCHHAEPMYIQCDFICDGTIQNIHNILFNYLFENNLPINYKIISNLEVLDGHSHSFIEILLPKLNNKGISS